MLQMGMCTYACISHHIIHQQTLGEQDKYILASLVTDSPEEHSPPLQDILHPPQFLESESVSVHVTKHRVGMEDGQVHLLVHNLSSEECSNALLAGQGNRKLSTT